MNKRILALVLVLALSACLFAGCSSSSSAETTTETTTAAESAPAAEPAATEPAAAQTAEEATPAAEPAAEAADDGVWVSPMGISYPLDGEDLKVTFWNSFMSFNENLTTNNDLPVLPRIKAATGVLLEFVEVSVSAATEQFQLMIASGDYTDVLKLSNYYTGGESQAYEDDVIIDLTDTLPVYAPDQWDLLMQQPTEDFESILVDGKVVTINGIRDGSYTDRGLVVRYDLLQQMNLTPEDITKSAAAFTDFLYAAKDQFGMDYALSVGQQGHFFSDSMSNAIQAAFYDTLLVDITSSTSFATYLEDGKVATALVGDQYREYLKWFAQLYQDGLFDREFYISQDQDAQNTRVGTGQTMIWPSGADRMDSVLDYADEANANMDIEAIPVILYNEGYENTWGSASSLIDLGYSITVNCEDPTMVESFYNYFFTEPGFIMVNYGEEGLSFNYDENGEPHFTELVTNNPDGLNPMGAAGYYGLNEIPYLKSESKLFDAYSEAARNAIALWTNNGSVDVGRIYPSNITLTTQESAAINNQLNDCLSYGQENLLKFMTGAQDVNDDAAWDSYVSGMEAFGMQTVLDVYQTAYDQYIAGERIASSGDAGGNPPPPPGD